GIDGIIWGLDVSDGFVYLVANTSSLYVVDVHDPARPELVSRSEVGKNGNAIVVRDGIAFIADGANGLVVVDVQDARHPFPVNTFNTGGYADRIYLQGPVAYIAQGTDGFAAIDLSNPGAPRKVGNYSQGQVDDLAVLGSLVLATGYEDVLQIVDVSDPGQPARVGNVHIPGANAAGVAVAASHAFVGARWLGLLAIDMRNPAKPILADSYRMDGFSTDLDVVNNRVYLADSEAGLQIIDATDPAKPERVGHFSDSGASGISVSNNLAYLGAWANGVKVLNVANPQNPTQLGQVATPGYASRIGLGSGLIFVPSGENGLRIVDAKDLAQPSLVGSLELGAWSYAVDVEGALAFVGVRSGLRVVNVSDPTKPIGIGSLSTQAEVYDVDVVGTLAYLANGTNGVRVVDVSDPTNPVSVSSVVTGGTASGIQFENGVVYLADSANGLSLIDARDPNSLAVIGRFPVAGRAQRVRVAGDSVYVAAGANGLEIFNVRLALPQSIVVNLPLRLPLSSEPFSLTATTSSGLPASFTLLSGPARLNAGNLELTDLGTITIRAEQAGNERFLPTAIQRSVEVIPPTSESVVSSWIARQYPAVPEDQRGLLADPDGDGAPNLLECLLSTDPGTKGLADGRLSAGRIVERDGQLIWEISVELNLEIASLVDWRFEASGGLKPSDWAPVPSFNIQRSGGATVLRVPISDASQFIRLRVWSL
ncbi:MAG: hypothetical protein L0Z50_42480, partial [Verrucomicrobiales bacterium]|nr:hypothetical protein [Verrucomicrobiales bacterium]